jgi:hypothetical protein
LTVTLAIGVVAAASLLSAAAPSTAQTVREPPPRVELGLAISTFPAARNMALGIRTTIHGTGRSALELQLDWTDLLRKTRYVDQQTWFYSWQVRHDFARRDPRSALFVSYGTLGWIERGQEYGAHDRFTAYVVLPFLPLVGIGGQRVLDRYVAIRGDLQFMIWPFEVGVVHPRMSASVTVPIGRYGRRL